MSKEDTPVLFKHCITLYGAMREEATDVGDDQHLWEGALVQKVDQVIGAGYYSTVVNALKKMGCIAMRRRGNVARPSQWYMLGEPTLESFHSASVGYASTGAAATRNEQIVKDLNNRVTALEREMERMQLELMSSED